MIIAEGITSRFLNGIGNFNGNISIMAIQMKAVDVPGGVGLIFTRVLDTLQLGLVDKDDEINEQVDRAYWKTRGSAKTVKLADQLLDFCCSFAGRVTTIHNKHTLARG